MTKQEICFITDTEISLSHIQLLNIHSLEFVEGEKYKIKGKTFPAISGHHHSQVMIVVDSIENVTEIF